MKGSVDMTHGPIAGKTMKFALFLAATGMMQQLFNAIDAVIMGQFVGKEAMAAVGSSVPLVAFIITFFIGISLGANVVIARLTGAGKREKITAAVHTSLFFALLAGLSMLVVGEILAEPILGLLMVPEELMPLSLLYLRIIFLALPGVLLYNFSSAIFRSQGDTRTPMVCLGIAGILKVIVSFSLVVFFHFGVAAVAISTACATLLSSGLLLCLLSHTKMAVRISPGLMKIDGSLLAEILRIGVPAGMQGAVFSLSNIVIQAAINSLGSDVMAASAAAFNLEILAYIFVNAFGQACTTFVGQNYGAGKRDRCFRVARITTFQNLAFTILLGGLIIYFGRPLMHLFTTDESVVSYGIIRIRYILLAEPLNLMIEMISGFLRGFGISFAPAVIVVTGICGSRVLYVATVFTWISTFPVLMAVYPLSWAITAAGLLILLWWEWKKIRGTADPSGKAGRSLK